MWIGNHVDELLIDLERAMLEQLGKGRVEDALRLCDDQISFFDPLVRSRIDDRQALAAHYQLAATWPQAVLQDSDSRAQAFGDTVVLSYILHALRPSNPVAPVPAWKVTEVYQRCPAGWRVVHSHRSLFSDPRSHDIAFAGAPADIGQIRDPMLRELLALEDAAMERWRQGDPLGFWELSALEVSYFDPRTDGRLDGSAALRRLYDSLAGRYHYRVSQYYAPRVQAFGDTAVLTFQYRSADVGDDGAETAGSHWNTTEVYNRIGGRWSIVHTHWSYTAAGAL